MSEFLFKRSLQTIVTMFGVVTLVFFIQRLSGDPTLLLVPEGASREDIEALRESLGFNRPLYIQYFEYLAGLMQLDFGRSVVRNADVLGIVASRLPYTLMLAGGALVVAVGIGIPLGVLMAVKKGTATARAMMAVVLTGQSLPTFWSGILLILLFAVTLGWLPASGARGWSSLILPSIALGLLSMATFARVARTAMLDELGKDYVRTARAKGVATRQIVMRHLLRNSSIPVITVAALEIANLLAGAVIVETVFAWPGLGRLAVESINSRDFPIVQAIVLIGSFAFIALNLLADILYSVVDPRIRLKGDSR
ncbi:ABC transporter permease [Fodinicurvata sp. EGI_FJ10296]|uniref:ABC transporter permease n=1 Tax=Fodinicurvata sp. EGI_FJ10296 TaxID=3231908 RepID=UPI003457345C